MLTFKVANTSEIPVIAGHGRTTLHARVARLTTFNTSCATSFVTVRAMSDVDCSSQMPRIPRMLAGIRETTKAKAAARARADAPVCRKPPPPRPRARARPRPLLPPALSGGAIPARSRVAPMGSATTPPVAAPAVGVLPPGTRVVPCKLHPMVRMSAHAARHSLRLLAEPEEEE
ncbi:hypothetical protein K458DRAFT_395415 [Lentithecium fluviatile CBS 122367]|uniref:Uncharacterized protein n=1 Tax=Lentithecium fluviatile CBS 122367 TaxID=1168545 RepID=A0A6G1II85_9PLEO|nr:hypothetical protein K458DRAFT_395415 [Lentithecium fluviatile CBS 122367]